MVREVTQANIGVYECRATNPAGIAADYATVELAVRPLVHVTLSRHMVARGGRFTVDCRVMQGTPTPSVRWFKDDRLLQPNRNLLIEPGRLTIQVSRVLRASVWECCEQSCLWYASLLFI